MKLDYSFNTIYNNNNLNSLYVKSYAEHVIQCI